MEGFPGPPDREVLCKRHRRRMLSSVEAAPEDPVMQMKVFSLIVTSIENDDLVVKLTDQLRPDSVKKGTELWLAL
eukprot:scaffold840_cov265-Pinguiococcus_pyrenoidosus.AAC.1